MKSDQAKVLFPIRGRPLLLQVLDSVEAAGFDRVIAVVGHQADRVRDALQGRRVACVLQEPQLGTGHAVMCAAPLLNGVIDPIAVLAGDAPLIRPGTLLSIRDSRRSKGIRPGRAQGRSRDRDCGGQGREPRGTGDP
jgi:bifunctional N-acetylglucosamine-1-phosphate-uridyltransferase/glucosamine-1-phosphate-acetyltransferase GlmU-like protein